MLSITQYKELQTNPIAFMLEFNSTHNLNDIEILNRKKVLVNHCLKRLS